MTDNEIVKALECCILSECENCPHDEETACKESLNQEVFDLINRQKAEIERLMDEKENLRCVIKDLCDNVERAQAEVVEEFAERLTEQMRHEHYSEYAVDRTLKEMMVRGCERDIV